MRYRATDPTLSTRDWFALSFDAIPTDLLRRTDDGDDDSLSPTQAPEPEPDWIVEPARTDDDDNGLPVWLRPDRGAYDDGEEGDADHSADTREWEAYEEERTDYARRAAAPCWGTMWAPRDLPRASGALDRELAMVRSCGIGVWEHPTVGYVFGLDGGGYSFYSAHWIPLRAKLAVFGSYASREDKAATLRLLREEARREGEARRVEEICEIAGVALDAPATEGAEVAQ